MRDLRPRGPADWWPASCSRAPPPSRAPTASASLMAIAPLDRGASTREGQALSGQAGSRPHLCARHHPAGPPVVTFLKASEADPGRHTRSPHTFPIQTHPYERGHRWTHRGDVSRELLRHNVNRQRLHTSTDGRTDQKVRGSNPFGRTSKRPLNCTNSSGALFIRSPPLRIPYVEFPTFVV